MPSASPEAGLAAGLAARLGGGDVRDLRRLSGGANMETWAFDWVPGAGRRDGQESTQQPAQGDAVAQPMILRHTHARASR